MELVRVLPSAEDEVNVACFHPFAGGGLVYGTKVSKKFPFASSVVPFSTSKGRLNNLLSRCSLITLNVFRG